MLFKFLNIKFKKQCQKNKSNHINEVKICKILFQFFKKPNRINSSEFSFEARKTKEGKSPLIGANNVMLKMSQ